MTRRIAGLAELADGLAGVLVDQFGVLHDGQSAAPGAAACLAHLRARGIRIVALTNSGRRAAENAERLARFGFPPRLFDAVISSGELARARIAAMLAEGALPPGAAVAVIARGGDPGTLAGLPLRAVPPGPGAALVLIAGAEPESVSLDGYARALAPLARAGVPALCANPDRWMQTARGVAFGPGQIAERYAALGGPVEMLGKPGAEMFRAGLAALGDPPPARCLMIGDSPEHDIAGAAAVGLRTLLVTSGPQSGTAAAVPPDHVIARLVW